MKRIERLNAILIHLQSKKVVTATELARRFNICLRTVYRDIRALEKAGIPIGAEAGTGYFLSGQFHLAPVSFSLAEASALLMGEKLMDKMSDHETREHYRSAIFKIRSILQPEGKDYLESLSNAISVYNRATVSPGFDKLFLPEIQQAIAKKQVLAISYHARYSDETTTRLVEPVGLCNYDSRWHLIGWCRLRNSYRDFRLDRISSLILSDESFAAKTHISMNEYFAQHLFSSGEANIRLHISPDQYKLVGESKYWYGFQGEKELPGGDFQIEFVNSDLKGFAQWLLASGVKVTVVFPAALEEIVLERVEHLASGYLSQQ